MNDWFSLPKKELKQGIERRAHGSRRTRGEASEGDQTSDDQAKIEEMLKKHEEMLKRIEEVLRKSEEALRKLGEKTETETETPVLRTVSQW